MGGTQTTLDLQKRVSWCIAQPNNSKIIVRASKDATFVLRR